MAGLTDEQVAQVRECVERVRAHSKLEPPMFHDLAHDTEPCEEWEEWNRQESELLDEYTDVIHAAVAAAMGNGMDQERFYTLLDVLMAAVAAGLADGNEPLLIRTGKATTMAVRGTTKRGTYDAGDGKPFVRAGDITISADNMGELNSDQITLLGYLMLRDSVMDGGFVELIHNGLGEFIFFNPFGKAVRECIMVAWSQSISLL